MIRHTETFSKYVALMGFTNVRLGELDETLNLLRKKLGGIPIQLLDADLIAGLEHLYFATLNAMKAFTNQTNISKALAIEIALYASARRQIKGALDVIGVRNSVRRIAVVLVADKEEVARKALEEAAKLIPGRRDDSVLDLSDEKVPRIRRLFGISDNELATKLDGQDAKQALANLVIEHVALLVTHR